MQFLVPRKLQREILMRVHDSRNLAHLGRHRTYYALQQFCHWYRLHEDVRWWIRTCDRCQRRKRMQPTPRAPMQIYKNGFPNERISMDICGPLVETKKGNKYMLVIGDHFTRYTQAFPLSDQTAESVANALVVGWIRYFGCVQD